MRAEYQDDDSYPRGEWETRSEPESPGEPLVGAGLSGTIGRVTFSETARGTGRERSIVRKAEDNRERKEAGLHGSNRGSWLGEAHPGVG